jgi:hypothetical protein
MTTRRYQNNKVKKMENNTFNRCRTCRWWRDKGWYLDEGIGICDNPKTIEQVSMLNEDMIKRFVPEPSDAKMIANSLRFSSEFGCINWMEIT